MSFDCLVIITLRFVLSFVCCFVLVALGLLLVVYVFDYFGLIDLV